MIEMPEYRRGVAIAYCDASGPLEKKQETFYAISPTPKDWPEKRADSFYREYNRSMLADLTVHEAMPGHFLQLMHNNTFPSKVRAVFSSGAFVEGWAVYGEWLMSKYGFGGPRVRMQRQKMVLRLAVNAVLDHGVHAGSMEEKDALDLMMKDAFQEEGEAVGKWKRARLSSAQLTTYYYGFTELAKLRAEMERRPGFTERAYHDELLRYGSPALRHIRALMRGPIPTSGGVTRVERPGPPSSADRGQRGIDLALEARAMANLRARPVGPLAALAFLLSTLGAGCQSVVDAPPDTPTANLPTENPGYSVAGNAGNFGEPTPSVRQSSTAPDVDGRIIGWETGVAGAERDIAHVAQRVAVRREVRDWAEYLASVYEEDLERLARLERAEQLAPRSSNELASAIEQVNRELTMLEEKTGPAFDDAFLAGQVTAHQGILGALDSYRPAARDPALRRHLDVLRERVSRNLETAQQLQQSR